MKIGTAILSFLVASVTLFGAVGQQPGVAAAENKQQVIAQADGNNLSLENNTLKLGFDATTGLAEVTDKRTGQLWKQHYSTPPVGIDVVQDPTFRDPKKWSLKNTSLVDVDGVRSVKIDLSTLSTTDTSKIARLNTPFPASPCSITDYDIVFHYKLENAKQFKLSGILHFEKGTNTWLGQKNFDVLSVNDPNGITTDWQEVRIPVSAAEFQEQTNSYLLFLSVSGSGGDQGNLYLSDVHMITKPSSLKPVLIENAHISQDSIVFSMNTPAGVKRNQQSITGSISFDKDPGTIKYDLGGLQPDSPFATQLAFPAAFHSGKDDLNWVIPKDAGLLLPSMDLQNAANQNYHGGAFYQYMGPNMAFIGATNLGSSDGYLMLVDTPISANLSYQLSNIDGKKGYLPSVQFVGDKGKWMEDRSVRFKFVESGGYVGIAKEYQKVAKQKGYYVELKDKEIGNPNVKEAAGAHRIDPHIYHDDAMAMLERFKQEGITNVMLKATALRGSDNQILSYDDAEFQDFYLTAVKKYHFPVFNYENYRDLFMKSGEYETNSDYVNLAKDWRIITKNGGFLTGWIDNQGNASYVLSPFFAKIGFNYRLEQHNLKDFPFTSRQFDTLGTSSLSEGDDYNPAHPSDRYTTLQQRQAIMDYTMNELKLAAHTEGAEEYLAPYAVTMEGSLGIMGISGVKDSDRIPLWELVFHGTSSIYYHWEHGSLTNHNRYVEDLYCMLYGEPQMFLPYYENYKPELLDDMVGRIKKINTVLNRVIDDEMTGFTYLTDDRTVQKSEFSSGIEVIVNFSKDTPFTYEGKQIQPNGYLVLDNKRHKEWQGQ